MKNDKNHKYLNRELAWLDFNGRVLEQARPESGNPLLERLRFLCMTASNLDEFFMIRVGGLQMLKREGKRRPDPAGMTPARQLNAVAAKAHAFMQMQYAAAAEIFAQMETRGLQRLDLPTNKDKAGLREWCWSDLAPLLTPMALDLKQVVPLLNGLKLYLLVCIDHNGIDRFVTMPLSPGTNRFRFLSDADRLNYMPLENIVMDNLDLWFGDAKIKAAVPFRITRNADLAVREDEGGHFLQGMERVLQERKQSHVVRLEIPQTAAAEAAAFLKQLFELTDDDIYMVPGPLQLEDYLAIYDLEAFGKLRFKPWTPCPSNEFNYEEPLFKQIAAKDIILFHPYESFAPVVHFLEEAAQDPDVLAIKQILYRTSALSPIVSALERAALNGKYVTAVVELKARFDEERNIGWARRLERAGVQVIYGVQGYKVHAKCCLVLRRENGHLRRYTHWSTGNYNEKTALTYSDVGMFSAKDDLGADASSLFNSLCGLDAARNFHKICISPFDLRGRIVALLNNEISQAKAGHKAFFIGKMNSCTDETMIAKLYEASQAGVEIRLNVRGACSLVPGVKGLSENIRVISIVGRFLEHARILHFNNGGSPLMFISSADCMTRNLDWRVEILAPVENKAAIKKLKEILNIYWEDNENCWELDNNGIFVKKTPLKNKPAFSSQKAFQSMAIGKSLETTGGKSFKPLRGR